MTERDRILQLYGHVVDKLGGIIDKQGQAFALCPAHNDINPSLHLSLGKKNQLLLCCMAGCTIDEIISRSGISMTDLFPDRNQTQKAKQKPSVVYVYEDEAGEPLYRALRYQNGKSKTFAFQTLKNGAWIWGLKTERVPYCLPRILAAMHIIIVEGEKDVQTVWRKVKVPATCNPCGAKQWPLKFGRYFSGKSIAIVPDADQPGREHAAIVAGSLVAWRAKQISICPLPAGYKDASDFLAEQSAEDFLQILRRGIKYQCLS